MNNENCSITPSPPSRKCHPPAPAHRGIHREIAGVILFVAPYPDGRCQAGIPGTWLG